MYKTPLTGSIYLVSDLNIACNNLVAPSTAVITLTEQPEYIAYIPTALKGSALLPPYEAIMALSDNNRMLFSQIYYEYLASNPDVNILITIITAAVLLRGMRILLLIPTDEMELDFFRDLSAYIYGVYGILIGTEQSPFGYQPCFDAINLEKMYLGGFITPQEFILEFPADVPISLQSSWKIINDLNIPIIQYYQAEAWVNNYVREIKQGGNVFRLKGVIRPCS